MSEETTPTLIESLQAQIQPIDPLDTMAEAGRKALLNDMVKMLAHEAGSRSGDDPEDVHDMRVSLRRMRSTLRLLASYYKPKAIDPYLGEMRKLARTLGGVRDLDVMIGDLNAYRETLGEDGAALQPVLDELNEQRAAARKDLIHLLDKGGYRRFVEDFSAFLTKPGKGAKSIDADDVRPFQVRHLLPQLIYEHLGAVRAYDSLIEDADDTTLHDLRIEFKRLRYVVSVFSDVLGGSSKEFISELKAIQDHLGNIVDIRVANEALSDIQKSLDPQDEAEAIAALQGYLDHEEAERKTLREGFAEVWRHFNTKTVQRQLATAVAAL
jgi:CHAD domain-containing protein